MAVTDWCNLGLPLLVVVAVAHPRLAQMLLQRRLPVVAVMVSHHLLLVHLYLVQVAVLGLVKAQMVLLGQEVVAL
jgi:hypothetical protein